MNLRYLDVQGVAGNLRVVPVDGEGDGRIAQDTEVEGIVCVLPDVLAAEDQVLANRLLQSRMELVAEARHLNRRNARRAAQQRRQHGVAAAFARKDEVLVEWSLQRACVGDAQHCLGRLYVVRD